MKRSKFLKQLGLGVAAVAVGAPILAEVVKEGIPIKVGDTITTTVHKEIITIVINGKTYWYNYEDYRNIKKFEEEREKRDVWILRCNQPTK